jgi:hypothetical protein
MKMIYMSCLVLIFGITLAFSSEYRQIEKGSPFHIDEAEDNKQLASSSIKTDGLSRIRVFVSLSDNILDESKGRLTNGGEIKVIFITSFGDARIPYKEVTMPIIHKSVFSGVFEADVIAPETRILVYFLGQKGEVSGKFYLSTYSLP